MNSRPSKALYKSCIIITITITLTITIISISISIIIGPHRYAKHKMRPIAVDVAWSAVVYKDLWPLGAVVKFAALSS